MDGGYGGALKYLGAYSLSIFTPYRVGGFSCPSARFRYDQRSDRPSVHPIAPLSIRSDTAGDGSVFFTFFVRSARLSDGLLSTKGVSARASSAAASSNTVNFFGFTKATASDSLSIRRFALRLSVFAFGRPSAVSTNSITRPSISLA